MYRKLIINFGNGKKSECSVGPFKDYEQASGWTSSLFNIIFVTEVHAIWEESAVPTFPLYPASTPPEIVLEVQRVT